MLCYCFCWYAYQSIRENLAEKTAPTYEYLKNGSVSKIEEWPWAICVFGGHGSCLTYTIMKTVLKSVH